MVAMDSRHLVLVFTAAVVTACGGSSDVQQGPAVPSTIQEVEGDGQSAPVSSVLPDSLRVKVTDSAGNAAPGVTVTWSVLSGGGAVTPTSSTTGTDGAAATQFTLG